MRGQWDALCAWRSSSSPMSSFSVSNSALPCVPAGFYCDSQQGPVTDVTLYPCPQGFYCPAGTSRSSQHGCPAGTFGPRQKLKSAQECQRCPAGKYCELPGLAAPSGALLFLWASCWDHQWLIISTGPGDGLQGSHLSWGEMPHFTCQKLLEKEKDSFF